MGEIVVQICGPRLAISRVRVAEKNMLDRESVDVLPTAKIAPTEHVGCMAVLGRRAGISAQFAVYAISTVAGPLSALFQLA